jgi:hypothetical protein
VQALVRPLAEHHALFDELNAGKERMMSGGPHSPIETAEAFHRLLFNPSTTHAELVGMQASADVWWDVLQRYPHSAAWVAANRHLPDEIAHHLAGHPNLQVRAALASNTQREDRLMELAHDKSEMIRLRVVCNAHTTRDALTTLAMDPCQVVAAHARARLMHGLHDALVSISYLDDLEVMQLLLH